MAQINLHKFGSCACHPSLSCWYSRFASFIMVSSDRDNVMMVRFPWNFWRNTFWFCTEHHSSDKTHICFLTILIPLAMIGPLLFDWNGCAKTQDQWSRWWWIRWRWLAPKWECWCKSICIFGVCSRKVKPGGQWKGQLVWGNTRPNT